MVEDVLRNGKTIGEACSSAYREKSYEADSEKIKLYNSLAIRDVYTKHFTSITNFPLFNKNVRSSGIKDYEICKLVDENLLSLSRCVQPTSYLKQLVNEKTVKKSFVDNCLDFLPELVKNVKNCNGNGNVDEERKALDDARKAEQKRKDDQARELAEIRQREAEQARIVQEAFRKAEEAARVAEQNRKAEEAARVAEQKRQEQIAKQAAEEAERALEEQKRAEEAAQKEAARLAAEQKRVEEAAAKEAARIAAEEKKKADAEALRVAEEKRKEEAARQAVIDKNKALVEESLNIQKANEVPKARVLKQQNSRTRATVRRSNRIKLLAQ